MSNTKCEIMSILVCAVYEDLTNEYVIFFQVRQLYLHVKVQSNINFG